MRHSSPIGDVWVKRVGALGEREVDEIDGGGSEEDVGGLQVRVQPSQGVQRSQPVCDVDGGVQNAAAPDGGVIAVPSRCEQPVGGDARKPA